MSNENLITGQLIFRKSSESIPGKREDPRKLMMVVGIFAVPEGINIKNGHKYTVVSSPPDTLAGLYQMIDPSFGRISQEFEEVNLKLLPDTAEDIEEETRGQSLGGLVTNHRRWRV